MPQCVYLTNTLTFGGVARQYAETVVAVSSRDIASCDTYILVTPHEFSSMNNPFFMPLSIADGLGISFAIGSLWALAFIFKAARRLFSSSTSED